MIVGGWKIEGCRRDMSAEDFARKLAAAVSGGAGRFRAAEAAQWLEEEFSESAYRVQRGWRRPDWDRVADRVIQRGKALGLWDWSRPHGERRVWIVRDREFMRVMGG